MIQCRIRELMAIKGRKEKRRVTYDDIFDTVGVNKTTLVKLANDRAAMIGTSVIDRLCAYFECQPGDLFLYIPDEKLSSYYGFDMGQMNVAT